MDIDTLITAVFKRPTIWDKRRKDHANRNVVDAAWKDISKEMNIEESKLRKKWKSLRDYFVSECNRKPPQRSGDAAEPRSKRWQYFDQLLFLKDIVDPRPSIGKFGLLLEASTPSEQDNITQDVSATTNGEQVRIFFDAASEDTRQSSSPTVEIDVDVPIGSTPVTHDVSAAESLREDQHAGQSQKEQPRKRQRNNDDQYKELLEIEKRKLEYFEKKARKNLDPEDDDLLFMKSLLPYIKMIPTEMKLHFRSRIQNVVADFAFANNQTNMRPSQSSSVSCYDTASMRYPQSHHSSCESTPYYNRAPSVSPHSYQSYDSEAAQPSYNETRTHFQIENFQ